MREKVFDYLEKYGASTVDQISLGLGISKKLVSSAMSRYASNNEVKKRMQRTSIGKTRTFYYLNEKRKPTDLEIAQKEIYPLLKQKPLSKNDIAIRLGIGLSTTTKVLNELINDGKINVVDKIRSGIRKLTNIYGIGEPFKEKKHRSHPVVMLLDEYVMNAYKAVHGGKK